VRGDIEEEKNVLVIKRIHVVYHLKARSQDRQIIERVHETHHRSCPVYMSLHQAIDITTELKISES
jgi:uncharacterized OsmC-like protein